MQQYADTSPPTSSATTACPGRCSAAWRAAERRYLTDGTEHDLHPREGQPVWCPPCTTTIRAAIAEWPALAAALREEVESGVSAALTEYVSGSKNRPVHEHEAASFLLDEVTGWLREWEDTVRSQLGLAERKTGSGLNATCQFLLHHLDWHLAGRTEPAWNHLYVPDYTGYDIATEFGLELLGYHRRAQILTGTRDPEPVRIEGVPCKNCDRYTLEYEVEGGTARHAQVTRFQYDDVGEVRNHLRPRPDKLTETTTASMQGAVLGYVRCRYCKPTFRMTLDEYRDWTKLQAAGDEARSRVTLERLTEIFGGAVPKQYRPVR